MISSLRRVLLLSGKELRSLGADPMLLAFIVYIFSVAIYQIATGVKVEVEQARIAIVDEDQSELSRRIASAMLPPLFRSADAISAPDIDPAMERGRYVFVIDIPPNFESDVLSDKNPTVQVDVDATAVALAGNGAVDIQNIVMQETRAYLHKDSGGAIEPVDLDVRIKFNPNLHSMWFTSVMEVINNISILSIILTGAALIREREHATVEHLLVMPVTPLEIMAAKILANGAVIVVASLASLQFVVRRNWPLARSAIASAEASPSISARSIVRPDTPKTSLATLASLMLAVSRSFRSRLRSAAWLSTSSRRQRSSSRSSRSGRGGTKLLAIRLCRTRSAIHSESFTSVLRPGTLRMCRALPTISSKCPSRTA